MPCPHQRNIVGITDCNPCFYLKNYTQTESVGVPVGCVRALLAPVQFVLNGTGRDYLAHTAPKPGSNLVGFTQPDRAKYTPYVFAHSRCCWLAKLRVSEHPCPSLSNNEIDPKCVQRARTSESHCSDSEAQTAISINRKCHPEAACPDGNRERTAGKAKSPTSTASKITGVASRDTTPDPSLRYRCTRDIEIWDQMRK